MKRALLIALAMAASIGAAHAQDTTTKPERIAFDARMFIPPPGMKTSYACFVRKYDADHLARHPKQKVAAMKLLMTAEFQEDTKEQMYSFRLGFRYRHRSGDFDSSGSCGHGLFEENGREVRYGCGVDCEGGGIGVAMSKDDKSVLVRLERVRVWQNNKPDDDAEESSWQARTTKIFRLDRAANADCASLVTDRKELAALRRK